MSLYDSGLCAERHAQNFELPSGDLQIDLIWYRDLAILRTLILDNLLVRENKHTP